MPQWITLAIAGAIVLVGVFAAWRPHNPPQTGADERKQLLARREKLFQDLLRLEADQRRGKGDPAKYANRREALLTELEQVYGALDGEDSGPGPASRAGLAA
jgi:hypothetical protein